MEGGEWMLGFVEREGVGRNVVGLGGRCKRKERIFVKMFDGVRGRVESGKRR